MYAASEPARIDSNRARGYLPASATSTSLNRATPIYGNPEVSIRSRSRHTQIHADTHRSVSSRRMHTRTYQSFPLCPKRYAHAGIPWYKRDIIGIPPVPPRPPVVPCLRRRVIGRSKVYPYTRYIYIPCNNNGRRRRSVSSLRRSARLRLRRVLRVWTGAKWFRADAHPPGRSNARRLFCDRPSTHT